MHKSPTDDHQSFLFQVDIMISAQTNGEALEKLLHILNSANLNDYRISSGIQLGTTIDAALAQSPLTKGPVAATTSKVSARPSAKQPAAYKDMLEQRIQTFITSNRLIRLSVNKGRGVKLSIPCRVLNFDPVNELLTVYHVDEKQVYSIQINEVDDFGD